MTFVAISKVSYPDHLKSEIEAVGRAMIPIAKTQPGFINVAFHQSLQKNQTMMIWEWQRKEDHEACLNSPQMNELMKDSGALFSETGIEVKIETYEKVE